jgi:hypothetical protein
MRTKSSTDANSGGGFLSLKKYRNDIRAYSLIYMLQVHIETGFLPNFI